MQTDAPRDITLQSRPVFWALAAAFVMEIAAVPFLWLDLPRNPMKPVIMAAVAGLTAFAAYRFSRLVRISATQVRVRPWFGRGGETVYDLAAVAGIVLRVGQRQRITRMSLRFTDGRKLELDRFQDGFDAGRELLLARLSHIEPVRESRWLF